MYCIVISFIYIFVMQIIIQMKNITTILVGLLLQISVYGSGPGKGASEIYELLESKCSSTFSMNVNKDFEDLFNMDIDLNGKEKWVKGDFSKGKFLVVNKEEANSEEILKEFKQRGYASIEIENDNDGDGDQQIFMMVDKKGDHLNEVHFIMDGSEKIVLLSIYGDIHLEKK